MFVVGKKAGSKAMQVRRGLSWIVSSYSLHGCYRRRGMTASVFLGETATPAQFVARVAKEATLWILDTSWESNGGVDTLVVLAYVVQTCTII
jgi:hypothetical protein